ncbi:MAG: transposase [Desulfobulbaceae bacterium]|nr:MAG: transposase [Desulfobulbaceae bacterium]
MPRLLGAPSVRDQSGDLDLLQSHKPLLEQARKKEKKSNAGAKRFDVVLLFKVLIFQSLYNLADEAMEFQILDRYSFSRFLGLHAVGKVPDATTIWRFREDLTKAGVMKTLFSEFAA